MKPMIHVLLNPRSLFPPVSCGGPGHAGNVALYEPLSNVPYLCQTTANVGKLNRLSRTFYPSSTPPKHKCLAEAGAKRLSQGVTCKSQ